MKVLHIIDTLGRGGAERLLVTLLPEIAKQCEEVKLAVRSAPYDLEPELEAAGIRVIRLRRRHKWNLVAGARDIARAMPDADVLHAHLFFPAVNTALARLFGFTQAVTCVTFHNLAYAGANHDTLALRFRKLLARAVYRRGMDAKLAVSQAVADHYRTALSLDHVDVVYNPIDLAAMASVRAASRDKDGRLHIVVPGRLVPEKGHTDLIAALRDPRLSDLRLAITFAGHGKLQSDLEAETSSLNFPLKITGALDHRRFLEVIASADIVVVPSRYEGFGLTALEAMALSKPVIASTTGGLPEVIGDAGRLVPVGDVGSLAAEIATLANDLDLRESLAGAARARAETAFGLVSIAVQLTLIYASSVRRRQHPLLPPSNSENA